VNEETRRMLQAVLDDVQRTRDFNESWIALHVAQGNSVAADRRREIVAERERWIAALSGVASCAAPLTYLACPYTHPDAEARAARFAAANRVAAVLMRRGEMVFSPISHTHPIAEAGDLPKGWDFWRAFDRAYLEHSKRVVVLCIDGWRESVGIAGELEIAAELGLPASYIDENGEEVSR